jgi:protein-disulfide isomerase
MLSAALLATPLPVSAQESAQAGDQAGDQGGWHVATQVTPIGVGDRVHGPANAAISVIVWLDPECPYCQVLGTTPERVIDASGGRANLAVRLYPWPFHGQNAMLASLSALCVGDQAGDGAYYRFLDAWLAMTGGNGKGIPAGVGNDSDAVTALAGASGARNSSALAACTRATATAQRLGEEMRAAQRANLSGTPAIAVRNNASGKTIMVAGAIEAEDLEAAISYMAKQSAP